MYLSIKMWKRYLYFVSFPSWLYQANFPSFLNSGCFFTDFTPASARPLLLGLYGAERSAQMPCLWQNCTKSPQNCGPLLLHKDEGQPSIINQVDKVWMTTSEVSDRRNWYNGYPLQWSTQMRYSFPPKEKRYKLTCCMGNPKCEKGPEVLIGLAGWDCRTRVHSAHEETIWRMSLAIPGQKYRPRARLVVFVMPEWRM